MRVVDAGDDLVEPTLTFDFALLTIWLGLDACEGMADFIDGAATDEVIDEDATDKVMDEAATDEVIDGTATEVIDCAELPVRTSLTPCSVLKVHSILHGRWLDEFESAATADVAQTSKIGIIVTGNMIWLLIV